MPELLSISIPTYNRASYLSELLESVKRNLAQPGVDSSLVRLYVYDNNSSDNTETVVKSLGWPVNYIKHEANIDGDPNIYHSYITPPGQYIWVIGDDELVPPGSIAYLLKLILEHKPGLIINKSLEYNTFVKLPFRFDNYRAFVLFAEKHNPHLLIAHSLISANVINRRCFDKACALKNVGYNYGPFYGAAKGLKTTGAPIIMAQQETLRIRQTRALNHPKEYIIQVTNNQLRYLRWLAVEYGLAKLKPDRVFPDYSRRLMIYNLKKMPIKYSLHLVYYFLLNKFNALRPGLERLRAVYKKLSPLRTQPRESGQ